MALAALHVSRLTPMQRWKLSALACAAIACAGITAADAWALSLGRLTVQSALGEPLKAEIEITQISAAEMEGLQAAIAPAEAFRAQGMEYTSVAGAIHVQLLRRSGGSAVLQLSSEQPVNEPFIDLVIDTHWASGKLQRNYTLLLDPPSSRRSTPGVTAAPQASAAESTGRTPARPTTPEQPSAPAVPAEPSRASAGEVRVKTGDTASQIALAHRPAGVSLDQTLVAMLRANPQAFINGNVNRMRSGVVMNLPDEASAKATSAREARQIMAAQARDFNQYRRRLARMAPAAPVQAASRAAAGQVQAQVQESKPASTVPDKLTLSKATDKGAKAEEKLAQQKQAQEQSSRLDELQRNMAELGQIATATKPEGSAASTAAGASPAQPPGIAIPAAPPVPDAAAASDAAQPAQATASADSQPAAGTPAPDNPATDAPTTSDTGAGSPPAGEAQATAEEPAPAPAPLPAPEAKPSFIDSLRENPSLPLAGAAILALLLGYGGYRVAQYRRAAAEQAELDDELPPADPFFDAQSGQPAHADAPPPEAAQAEIPVLHETPAAPQAEAAAPWAQDQTGSTSLAPDATRAQDTPPAQAPTAAAPAAAAAAAAGFGSILQSAVQTQQSPPAGSEEPGTRLPAPEETDTAPHMGAYLRQAAAPAAPEPGDARPDTAPTQAPAAATARPEPEPEQAAEPPAAAEAQALDPLDFDFEGFAPPTAQEPTPAPETPSTEASAPATRESQSKDAEEPEDLEFDLSGLSLDLGDTSPPSAAPPPTIPTDPLATKLALAQEFHAIGDSDGARSLLEEVIAEADGDLKARAQSLLAKIA